MGKRVYTLLSVLVLVLLYSLVSLLYFEDELPVDDYADDYYQATDTKASGSAKTNAAPNSLHNSFDDNYSPSSNKQETSSEKANMALPFELSVIGISQAVENQASLALIQFEQELHKHTENEFIASSNLLLEKIAAQHIVVLYEDTQYIVNLEGPNLLADTYREPEPTYDEFLAMSADDIGSRPRIIEHLATLTPTPYIADGKLLSPGINPALFKQAGFQEDDVLKKINGKSVTIDNEFEEIKNHIKYATTLKFEVMRKGRIITLYLDIPSEALELKP